MKRTIRYYTDFDNNNNNNKDDNNSNYDDNSQGCKDNEDIEKKNVDTSTNRGANNNINCENAEQEGQEGRGKK